MTWFQGEDVVFNPAQADVLSKELTKLFGKHYPELIVKELVHEHVAAHFRFLKSITGQQPSFAPGAKPLKVGIGTNRMLNRKYQSHHQLKRATMPKDVLAQEIKDLLESKGESMPQHHMVKFFKTLQVTEEELLDALEWGVERNMFKKHWKLHGHWPAYAPIPWVG